MTYILNTFKAILKSKNATYCLNYEINFNYDFVTVVEMLFKTAFFSEGFDFGFCVYNLKRLSFKAIPDLILSI